MRGSVTAMVERHSAVTDWQARFERSIDPGAVNAESLREELVRQDHRPLLFFGFARLRVDAAGHCILVLDSDDEMLAQLQLQLGCDSVKAMPTARDIENNNEYAVIASIDAVEAGNFDDPSSMPRFVAEGRLVELLSVAPFLPAMLEEHGTHESLQKRPDFAGVSVARRRTRC